jgi:hypothetical protein
LKTALAAAVAIAMSAASPGLARCEPGREAASPADRAYVEVFIAASPEAFATASDTMRELLARLHIVPTVQMTDDVNEAALSEPRTSARPPLVRAVVDMRPRSPSVLVEDGASRRVLVHRVLPPSDSIDVTVEEVSHVVYMAVDSVLREPPQAPPPVPAKPPAPEAPRSAAPRVAPWGLDAAMFFAASVSASSRVLYGAGAGLDLGWRGTAPRLSLGVSATVFAPAQYEAATVDALVMPVSLRVAPGIEWLRTSLVAAEIAATTGLDWFRVEPGSSQAPGARIEETTANLDPTVGAAARARVRLRGGVDLLAGLALDFDCYPHRYVVAAGGDYRELFLPPRWRPSLVAGLTFPVAGSAHFEETRRPEEASR